MLCWREEYEAAVDVQGGRLCELRVRRVIGGRCFGCAWNRMVQLGFASENAAAAPAAECPTGCSGCTCGMRCCLGLVPRNEKERKHKGRRALVFGRTAVALLASFGYVPMPGSAQSARCAVLSVVVSPYLSVR